MGQDNRILANVSRETHEKLDRYVELLLKWNRAINLVSKSTIDEVWLRHIADSLQLVDIVESHPVKWLDMGSGGGLPGLVVAAKCAELCRETHVTLLESDRRKCAFLSAAANAMGLDVTIECRRVEESGGRTYDVISARALAPLSDLLELALPYRHSRTICIFPKGAKAAEELETAQENWIISYDRVQSQTDPTAAIIKLQEYVRV